MSIQPDDEMEIEGGGWAMTPGQLLYDSRLTFSAKTLYSVLVFHINGKTGACFPGFERLALLMGMNARSLYRPMKELETTGWVRRKRRVNALGHRTSDRYVICQMNPSAKPVSEVQAEVEAKLEALSLDRAVGKPSARSSDQARDSTRAKRAHERAKPEEEEPDEACTDSAQSATPPGASETDGPVPSPSEPSVSESVVEGDTETRTEIPRAFGQGEDSAADAADRPPQFRRPPPATPQRPKRPRAPKQGALPREDVERVLAALCAGIGQQSGCEVEPGAESKWAGPVRLLLDAGPKESKRPIPEPDILGLIEWLYQPGSFWGPKVSNGFDLREKWLRLAGEWRNAQQPKAEATPLRPRSTVSDRNAESARKAKEMYAKYRAEHFGDQPQPPVRDGALPVREVVPSTSTPHRRPA